MTMRCSGRQKMSTGLVEVLAMARNRFFAPGAHAGCVAADDGDAGDEVAGVVDVDIGFEALFGGFS